MSLTVPNISIIIGEGGSGGAIALASSNKVIMLENSIYSVISPEGCASILWRDANKANDAAKALKLTAEDMKAFKVIDEIIQEPLGGAHRDHNKAISELSNVLEKTLVDLLKLDKTEIKEQKETKYLKLHEF